MNNIKFLLIGTSLSLIPTLTFAQCVATQDCETLGYTETSCKGSKGIKCPFGNKWACLTSEEECLNLACDKLGFTYTCTGTGEKGVGQSCNGKYQGCSCDSTYQYTCTGTGYAGGAGSACGGKYNYCNCSSGYEWKNGSCQKKITDGAVGDKYYCNGKVVGVRVPMFSGEFFMAIENAISNGSQVMDWNAAKVQAASAFCGKGRLPTKDELLKIYKNKSEMNGLFTAVGGQTLTNGFYWSMTYDYDRYADKAYPYFVHMFNGAVENYTARSNYVRPVLFEN